MVAINNIKIIIIAAKIMTTIKLKLKQSTFESCAKKQISDLESISMILSRVDSSFYCSLDGI